MQNSRESSDLKQIQSLSLYSASITDAGLQYIANMPVLKKLRMYGSTQISDDGLEWLKHTKPDLTIELPSAMPHRSST